MKQFDIESRRKELNLTLEQIGKYVGVSKSTVKKWETGFIDNMKRDKIALLADILKVSPLEIIGIETKSVDSKNLKQKNEINLFTPHEQKVIKHYRQKPEMQPAVDKLLGIEDNESKNTPAPKNFTPNIAAASGKEIKAKKLDIDTMIEIEKMK